MGGIHGYSEKGILFLFLNRAFQSIVNKYCESIKLLDNVHYTVVENQFPGRLVINDIIISAGGGGTNVAGR